MNRIARKTALLRGLMLCAVSFTLTAPPAAWAQVEEIVVTARKKEESLQDVPMSVTAFTSGDIERKGISSIADVAKLTSSVQFDESFAQSDTRIVIRGLSPTRGRQNAAVLVDGIDLSSEAIVSSGGSLLINNRLIDVERIEVVAGPQMALYGRSAFNGAIQYITKDPSPSFETKFDVDANAADRYSANASVSGPVFGDLLGVRLNATWWDEEGYYNNTLTSTSIGGSEGLGFALTTKSLIGDNLTVKFRGEFTADKGEPSPQAFIPFNVALDVPESARSARDFPGEDPANYAGVAECYPDFINALAQGVPGDAENLLTRLERIAAPSLVADVMADGTTPEEIVAANPFVSPYCEYQYLGFSGKVPDGDDLIIRAGTDPSHPGKDYEGFDRHLWRVSLVSDLALDRGTFTLLAGFLSDKNTETQDTNAFGVYASGSPYLDINPNSFTFNNEKETTQKSLEVRFASALDGPAQVTLGGLYWEEDVKNDSMSITAQQSGSHCMWSAGSGALNPLQLRDGCTGYTFTPNAPYQEFAAPYRKPSPVDRNTDHWSIYGMLELDVAESWTVSFEGRYNRETTKVKGPISYEDPAASGGPGGLNTCGIFFRACQPYEEWLDAGRFYGDSFFPYTDEGAPAGTLILDQAVVDAIPDLCWEQDPEAVMNSIENGPAEVVRDANGNIVADDLGGATLQLDGNGRAIPTEGLVDINNPWCVGSLRDDDSWFSPKITLDWAATEDMLLYVSWADARKPGGLSLLTVGSSFLNRELAEFKPEKMQVWEAGANTAWLSNSLIINGAVFFQDYTDKQALTSALNERGDRLVSKIVNAGSAEVWGAELSVTWQPIGEFLGGNWRLTGSYTWLDTEYTDFELVTSSPNSVANAGNCTPVFEQTATGDTLGSCIASYTGNELEDAAPGAFVGSMNYTLPITSGLDMYVETDVQWTDERYTNIENQAKTRAFWNADLRIGVQSDNWDVLVYVNNVFDDDTVRFTGGGPGLGCCFVLGSSIDLSGSATGNPTPASAVIVDLPTFDTAFLPAPRNVGLRATYRFGGD